MQVGLRRLPGVSTRPDPVADPDSVFLRDAQRAQLEVHQANKMLSVLVADDHVVISDRPDSLPDAPPCVRLYGIRAGNERRATWSGSPSWIAMTCPSTGAGSGLPNA